jgi:hypothetical protein
MADPTYQCHRCKRIRDYKYLHYVSAGGVFLCNASASCKVRGKAIRQAESVERTMRQSVRGPDSDLCNCGHEWKVHGSTPNWRHFQGDNLCFCNIPSIGRG